MKPVMDAISSRTGLGLKERFIFRLRNRVLSFSRVRTVYWTMLGMRVGIGTRLPTIFVTWPHQVEMGSNCTIEHNVIFKFDGVFETGPSICFGNHVFIGSGTEFNIRVGLKVGNDSLIASGCRFVDHDHGILLRTLMREQEGSEASIMIGSDVWLGCNVVVLKGVTIGDGAIVGAGAVVTKSIGEREIWAGIPARKIGMRPDK